MLEGVDGILLGGSDTNVDPRSWGEAHPAYGRIMNAYVRACWERLARGRGAPSLPPRPVAA